MLLFKFSFPKEIPTTNTPKSYVQFHEFETSHSREEYGIWNMAICIDYLSQENLEDHSTNFCMWHAAVACCCSERCFALRNS